MLKRPSRNAYRYLLTASAILFLAIAPTARSQSTDKKPAARPTQPAASTDKKPAARPTQPAAQPATQPTDANNDELKPLNQADSLLSYQGGQRLMQEASAAINAGKYTDAVEKLNQARRIFNQLSNYHLQLANSFSGIDPKVFDAQRQNALTTGQARDEATYQLALVHRAQNQPELAVPLLIQVIQSQNPASELGQKCYQQLYEMGFVSVPYNSPAPTSAAPTPPANAPSAKQ